MRAILEPFTVTLAFFPLSLGASSRSVVALGDVFGRFLRGVVGGCDGVTHPYIICAWAWARLLLPTHSKNSFRFQIGRQGQKAKVLTDG